MSLRKVGLDEYAHLDSILHRWEPKCRLVSLLILIFAFSFVRNLRLLPLMVTVTIALYALSHLPFSFLAARLRYPGLFLTIPLLLLPFWAGNTILLQIGALALRQEGCRAALLIFTRFISILTVSIILFGVAPFLTTIKTMRALGLPAMLADMTLLAYRYLYEIGDDWTKMETATRLRGFQPRYLDKRILTMLAALVGSLLARSYERSERVYKAMKLRGYDRMSYTRAQSQIHQRDILMLSSVLTIAASLVIAQITL